MSHFVTVVILPENTTLEAIHRTVEDMLEPFNENMEVEPYEEDCYCIGSQMRREVVQKVIETFGQIEPLRNYYWGLPENERTDDLWTILTGPRRALEDKLTGEHPLKDSPDPKCESCNGTGIRTTTSNPIAKWDWWVIGGRWDGWIFGPAREMESRDEDGFNFGDEHHTVSNNVRLVKDIPIEEDHYVPFAVLTPEGWHERGKMGWWGMVSNEKDKDNWNAAVKYLYSLYPNCIAVACDLHI